MIHLKYKQQQQEKKKALSLPYPLNPEMESGKTEEGTKITILLL